MKHFVLKEENKEKYNEDVFIDRVLKTQLKDLPLHEKFMANVLGEYGCKDYFVLREAEDYDPDNDLVTSNSAILEEIENNILKWTQLLLQGKKYFILAGNDAHGNFNIMRQIKSPFWKLFSSSKQVFGKFFTAFKFPNNDPVAGIKNGEIIVSNGPFLNFQLQQNKQIHNIGSSCSKGKATFVYEAVTNIEFGKISKTTLHIGDLTNMQEAKIENPESGKVIDLPECGYLRMSMKTEKDGLAYTNPIWVV